MTAGSDKEDDVILAGEYALGLLSGGAAEAFEARLAVEPELRALYASWAEDFAAMVDKVPEQAPRPEVREQIEAALFGRAVGRTPGRAPGVWARIGLGRGLAVLAVAAVLAAVVFGSGLLERGPVPPVAPTQRAEIAAEDGALVIAAAFERTTGRAVPVALGGRGAPRAGAGAVADRRAGRGRLPRPLARCTRGRDDHRHSAAGADERRGPRGVG